jgi:hypothetical protein
VVPLQFGIPVGPELLVVFVLLLGLCFVALSLALAYWVYTDAERRGEESAALWALGVGALTLTTFFGGVLALAVYVWQRGDRVTG